MATSRQDIITQQTKLNQIETKILTNRVYHKKKKNKQIVYVNETYKYGYEIYQPA